MSDVPGERKPVYYAYVNSCGLNPSIDELNIDLHSWLSEEERKKIKEVMIREEEFMKNENSKLLRSKEMEGQLSKFTNLMKGWQNRWFVLDPEKGTLTYFLDKERVKHTPRGSVHLIGAVIAPSDEDSNLFTVHASNGDIYKLRAADARSRQHWINMMRAVAEYHGTSHPAPKKSPAPLQRSSTIGSKHGTNTEPPSLKRTATYSHAHHRMPLRPLAPKTVSPPAANELHNVKDAMNSVDEYHASVIETLENGYQTGEPANPLDENVLILKATSQAMVNILHQCGTILQHQATELQATAQATGLPPGAHIEWLEPSHTVNQNEMRNKRPARERQLDVPSDDERAENDASKLLEIEFDDIKQYEKDEVIDIRDLDEASESMEPHRTMILSILSQLKLGMDLTRVVLPTFVLEKRSLLEMYADFFAHADLFARITDQQTPEDRMFAVLEFYLTSFHVGRKASLAKKPYNPIIGETFHCSYDVPTDAEDMTSSNGQSLEASHRVHYVAEQVSHHPPISAFYAECPHKNTSMNAHIWTKSKFYGMSIGVVNVGEGVISLHDHDEEYLITFPNAYCRSILTYPWVELGGRTLIKCAKTGYAAVILFHTKPFYGGTENKISAEVKYIPTGNICCRAEGSWNGSMDFSFADQEVENTVKALPSPLLYYDFPLEPQKFVKNKCVDVSKLPVCLKRVRPTEMQKEFESRRLWSDVTSALKENNLETATSAKHKLEERQRAEEKQRLALGVKWKTKLFHKIDDVFRRKKQGLRASEEERTKETCRKKNHEEEQLEQLHLDKQRFSLQVVK
eukprot:gene16873-18578_t